MGDSVACLWFSCHTYTHIMPSRVLVERIAPVVGAAKKRTGANDNTDGTAASTKATTCEGWRVLENGVLAAPTSIEVVTEDGRRRIWCDPRSGGRLVCPHGWGAYHLNGWNGPRAHLFPKPAWTTCDCRSATGLCGGRAAKRQRCEAVDTVASGVESDANSGGGESGGESDCTVVACGPSIATPPSYYETLVAQHGTTELRTGLKGARVPGVVGSDGGGFYMVTGDAASVLRCRHGQTTNTLATQARERRRWAACLVAAAIFGRKQRRVSVLLLLALHSTREARRARRGAVAPCGCATVHVKACVLSATAR